MHRLLLVSSTEEVSVSMTADTVIIILLSFDSPIYALARWDNKSNLKQWAPYAVVK